MGRGNARFPVGGRFRFGCVSTAALLSLHFGLGVTIAFGDEQAALSAANAPADVRDLAAEVNAALRLTHSDIATLDVNPTVGAVQIIQIPLDGTLLTLELRPHSVRDPLHYRVLAQVGDGSFVEHPAAPIRTLRGQVTEIDGSTAAASLLDDGLYGAIRLPGGVTFWFEPLAGRFNGAAAGDYVIYRADAAFSGPGVCGNLDPDAPPAEVQDGPDGDTGGIAGATVCTAQIACDADREFFVAYGSSVTSVENRINTVINLINLQYGSQADISHLITTILVRTAEPDPYTSSTSGVLLSQFRSEWLLNQTGIVRDVAKLFTGRAISGGIVGQAWAIGGICTDNGYCYSWSDCCGSTACATDLAAHELGHLWSATHCTCTSPPYTMNPSLTCSNSFSADSIAQIIAHRNSRTCLSCSGGAGNDGCAGATPIGNGSFAFSTVGATTDGPDEPGICSFASYSQIGADIWYRYTAACTGTVTVDLCSSSYDTKVAVYGSTCPGSASAIACNDDACGTSGLRSRVNFVAVGGAEYLIRIGGYQALTGTGTLTITCTPSGPPNDDCANAIAVSNNAISFSTVSATTDGPNEPAACTFFGYTQVGSDVWYRYTASACPGTTTVSICDATYDTKMAIYAGAECPLTAAALLCSDDACGTNGLRSQISFSTTPGGVYLIRIGGYNGLTGAGILAITSSAIAPTIGTHPVSQTVCTGGSVVFSVVAAGSGGLSYQWRKGGAEISGATGSSYSINPVLGASAGDYDVIVTDACGSTPSNPAALTVNSPVAITGQPVGQSVCIGSPVTFTVSASGSAPLAYQWQRNTVNIAGATSAAYTIPAVSSGQTGSYRCIVTNPCGSLTSSAATLSARTAPIIGAQPISRSVCPGESVTFTVLAGGTAPLSYQWQRNTVNIAGATSNSLTINPVTTGSGGGYRCVVTNVCASVPSNTATLTVLLCCPGERGDTNCDGAIDFFDIDPFLLSLFEPASYAATYCGGSVCAADTDCSGGIDFFDIDPLLSCLFAACPDCP